MSHAAHNSPPIRMIDAGLRSQAMDLLWRRLDAKPRRKLIASFEAESEAVGSDYWSGLIGAFRGDQLVGAAWTQWQPGRSAMVHGPQLCDGEPPSTAKLLASALTELTSDRDIRIAQALHEADDRIAAESLLAVGFEHAAELQYMFCDTRAISTQLPQSLLTFEPYSPALHERFSQTVAQTYRHSLDCPRVDGVRTIDDALASYQATGVFNPSNWLLVSHAAVDVGCLLLAEHPESHQSELVYMGVVPQARGKGWGLEIVRYAAWLAKGACRARLALAVDADNWPAIATYSAAGFITWDRRHAFLRVFEANGVAEKTTR
jgi:GNAT superfamily N-acetyltransferase